MKKPEYKFMDYTKALKDQKKNILDILDNNYAFITFRKKTNEYKRPMFCTRNIELAMDINMTEADLPKGTGGPKKEYLIPVWDLEKGAWRSFYVNRLFQKPPAQVTTKAMVLQAIKNYEELERQKKERESKSKKNK